MIMRKGQVYRCQNEQCGAEIMVTTESSEGDSNPRCCCGAQMKKPYAKPALTRLELATELIESFKSGLAKSASA